MARLSDAADGAAGLCRRRCPQRPRGAGAGVWLCGCGQAPPAHTAPPLPGCIALQNLHGRRHHETPRSRQASAGRSGRPVRGCPAPDRRGNHAIAAPVAFCRADPRRGGRRAMAGPAPVFERTGIARGPRSADFATRLHALQIFELRLWPRRSRDRGGDGRELQRLGWPRNRGRREASGNHDRWSGGKGYTHSPRPYPQTAGWAADRAGRQPDQRFGPGDRLRLDRGRPRALFR